MESVGNVLCFICSTQVPQTEMQDHIFKCKLKYETAKKLRVTIPEEYNLLFKTIKGGLLLEGEDLNDFNNLIRTKTLRTQTSQIEKDYSNPMGMSQSIRKSSPQNKTLVSPKKNSPPKRAKGQRPIGLICPLCGREFGTASLEFHMKSCRVKFEREQQDLPKNLRRSADKIIASYNQNAMVRGSGGYNFDDLNNQAFDTYKKEALVPCSNCGRTFLPDRLIVHQRSCLKHPKKP